MPWQGDWRRSATAVAGCSCSGQGAALSPRPRTWRCSWRRRRTCGRRSSSRSRPSSGTPWCRIRRLRFIRDTGRRSRIGRPAIFFDRDGVVNELVSDPRSRGPESPLDPDDVALVPGAALALGRLRKAGYLLVALSNPPAAAKAVVTIQRLRAVQVRVLDPVPRG